ncbi:YrhB domain-containing protein [Microcoleus sp. M2_C2]|uniref:YrhB domain-containing protein n=1 Tax=Microcoleus sp. M2_C2 TaxID=3055369 RepID=UPI002FCEFCE4
MLSRDQAQALAENELSSVSMAAECELAIVASATLERPFGWVFFYESREYLDTGAASSRLAGNAPFFVNRLTGEVVAAGTAHSVEYYLALYEASLTQSGA